MIMVNNNDLPVCTAMCPRTTTSRLKILGANTEQGRPHRHRCARLSLPTNPDVIKLPVQKRGIIQNL